jgi:predicted PurR-regulated permease PerM
VAEAWRDQRASRFLLGLLLVLGVLGLLIVLPFLSGTVFAILVGFLLQRPYRAVVRVVRWPPLAAGLVVAGVVLALGIPLLVIVWQLAQDVQELLAIAESGQALASAVSFLTSLGMAPDAARDTVLQAKDQAEAFLRSKAIGTLGALGRLVANFGIFVFLLFYILLSGRRMAAALQGSIPLPEDRAAHLMQTLGARIRALFLGTFFVALIQGGLAMAAWWGLGFPRPFFWGFIMFLLSVIPAVGPALVMVPAGLLAIMQGDTFAGVALIVWGVVVVGLVDNFARPYVVGRHSDVHPTVVLLGTLGGLALFGTPGFVIGPLVLSLIQPLLEEWRALPSRQAP